MFHELDLRSLQQGSGQLPMLGRGHCRYHAFQNFIGCGSFAAQEVNLRNKALPDFRFRGVFSQLPDANLNRSIHLASRFVEVIHANGDDCQ